MSHTKQEEGPQDIYKIVLAGNSGVGKTFILHRYIKNQVPKGNPLPTIGVEFATKIVKLKSGENVKAQIWDTAGQERYRSITTAKAKGALLVYDVTKEKTFDDVSRWIEDIKNMAEPDLIILIVANKIDLVNKDPALRRVSREEGQKLAVENDLLYIEASALEGININNAFEELLNAISNKKKQTIEENGKSKSLILKEGDNGVTNNNNQGVCKGC